MTIDTGRRTWLLAAATIGLGSRLASSLAQPAERVIRVVAKRFEFTPSEIHVRQGESVALEFTTLDLPMGFNVAELGVRCDILPGLTTALRLKPSRAGSYAFNCDVFCGSGHEEMGGVLIVDA